MKRTYLLVLIIFLPLLLSAGLVEQLRHMQLGMPTMELNRGWRLHERLDEEYQSAWVPMDKYVYYYQSSVSSKLDSVQVLGWDSDSGSYQISMTWQYEYTPSGQISASTGYYVIPGMGYINVFNTLATYDPAQRLLHYYMNMLDMNTGLMLPFNRMHFIYSGNRLTTMFSWNSGLDKQGTYDKNTFSYNGQGQTTELVGLTSNDSLNWVNSESQTISYHPNDTSNENTVIQYFSQWLPMALIADPWMIFGMPAQTLINDWIEGAWVPSARETFSWNNQNKMQSRLTEIYTSGAWQPESEYTLSYDANNNVSQVVEEYSDTGVLQPEYRYNYNWENYTSVEDALLPSANSLQLRCFPLPFSAEVNILADSKEAGEIALTIYNLKGQLIHQSSVLPGNTYKWNGLDTKGGPCASGIYFLKAAQGNKTSSSRIVKLK